MKIPSPLVAGAPSVEVKKLAVEEIVASYQHEFGMDVSAYFDDLSEISIYQCIASKLKFYYPFNLAGNEQFYDELSKKYGSYYAKWKWEHERAINFLGKGDEVLEIGCGNGYFLQKAKKIANSVTGLDFNPSSVDFGKNNNLNILPEDISEHAKAKAAFYDYVAAFQLFEHVNDVGNFLAATISCLKKGGKFVIGVPDNDSAIFKYMPYHTLNLPPHHMLLWDKVSLLSLAELYNLKLIEIANQPASRDFKSAAYKAYLNQFLGKGLLAQFLHVTTRFFVKRFPVFNTGQTVLAIFEKQ